VTLKLPKIKPTSKFGAGFLILKYFYRTTIINNLRAEQKGKQALLRSNLSAISSGCTITT